jgi:hypothetical protein
VLPPALEVPQDSSAQEEAFQKCLIDHCLYLYDIPPLQLRQGWWRASSPVPGVAGETQQIFGNGHYDYSLFSYQ